MRVSEKTIRLLVKETIIKNQTKQIVEIGDTPRKYHAGAEENVKILRSLIKENIDFEIKNRVLNLISNGFAKMVLKKIKKISKVDAHQNLIPKTPGERSPFKDKKGNFKEDNELTEYAKIVKKIAKKLHIVRKNSFTTTEYYANPNSYADEDTFKLMKTHIGDSAYDDWGVGGMFWRIKGKYTISVNDALYWKMFEENDAGFFMGCKGAKNEFKIRIFALFGKARFAKLPTALIREKLMPKIENTVEHEIGHVYDRVTNNSDVLYFAKKILSSAQIDYKDSNAQEIMSLGKKVVKKQFFKGVSRLSEDDIISFRNWVHNNYNNKHNKYLTKFLKKNGETNFSRESTKQTELFDKVMQEFGREWARKKGYSKYKIFPYLNLQSRGGITEIRVRISSAKRYLTKIKGSPKSRVRNVKLTPEDIAILKKDFDTPKKPLIGSSTINKNRKIHNDVEYLFNPNYGIIDRNASNEDIAAFLNGVMSLGK